MVCENLVREFYLTESKRFAPADHTKENIKTIEQQASASKLLNLSRFCLVLNSLNKIVKMFIQL